MNSPHIARIAVPTPLRRYFDYLAPMVGDLQPGMRVKVPFGSRELIGVFMGFVKESDVALDRLKPIKEIIDKEPLITSEIFQLCLWAADYYHYPVGEVFAAALPVLLKQGKAAALKKETYWFLTEEGQQVDFSTLQRAPKQIELLKLFSQHPNGLTAKQLKEHRFSSTILKMLVKKNWASVRSDEIAFLQMPVKNPLALNSKQERALSEILLASDTFQVFLLDGVTGSGKTEVYLQAISEMLQQEKQVLVLVPEIGLTPQTIQRFKERYTVPVVALHSGLSEKERVNAWTLAKENKAKIVIGTRSAIFTPFSNLGLIVIDEEHDLSFKQQEGFRYHARDLAIMRAHFGKIPIILGSATPSLESLHKAQQGRYKHLHLPERAGDAKLPQFHLLDICKLPLEEGLSAPLLTEMKNHLQAGNQVMLFLNRRGFAPILICRACGWIAMCKRCDMRMTYHQNPRRLHCHHCDLQRGVMKRCEKCGDSALHTIGLGTERLESVLEKYFPDVSIARIDRDSTQRKGAIENILEKIHAGEHKILIGTQMLAKGHHFPDVTLVIIVDADGGFFSADFRALERMGQLVLQVAGRAGRVEKAGKVFIQTHHPDHPLLHQLIHESYNQFALTILQDREQAKLPPYHFFALFRADAYHSEQASQFLQEIKNILQRANKNVRVLGPIASPMPRKAGRYRMQLLMQSTQRPVLQKCLKEVLPEIEKLPNKQKIRWSLDVDPLEMF